MVTRRRVPTLDWGFAPPRDGFALLRGFSECSKLIDEGWSRSVEGAKLDFCLPAVALAASNGLVDVDAFCSVAGSIRVAWVSS